jgi:fluoride exporter
MRHLLLVGIGGFLGSIGRYYLGGAVLRATGAARFPWGTLVVNVVGCLFIGLLGGLAERRHLFDAATRLFLLTGVLGGFTPFSAFAYETYFLGREQAWVAAAANIGLQLVLGLFALGLGHQLARLRSN